MSKFVDLTGKRFGNFTVLRKNDTKTYTKVSWVCQCDCGEIKVLTSSWLNARKSTECHCKFTHHNDTKARLYRIYIDMIRRCTNPKNKAYKYYGQRGIKVCNKWLGKNGYLLFRKWALSHGYRNDLTIDRINVNGNYSPQNCRWATTKQQGNNTRVNRWLTLNGEKHTVAEWSEITGIKSVTILSRLRQGWSEEDALTKPIMFKSKPKNPDKYIYRNDNRFELVIKGKYMGCFNTFEEAKVKKDAIMGVSA